MKEGYPKRVCDYCHLQLNTFHAFVRKAKTTSTHFENMLKELKRHGKNNEPEQETNVRVTNSELLSANMEFDMSQDNDNDKFEIDSKAEVEMEFIIDKTKVQLTGDGDIDIPANEVEGLHLIWFAFHINHILTYGHFICECTSDEYTIEYLDPEYEDDISQNTFDDEITQNDGEEGEEEEGDEQSDSLDNSTEKSTKPRSKRTYPYKCTKCNKRFVYKEVYEAHIRIHKGLPGFS